MTRRWQDILFSFFPSQPKSIAESGQSSLPLLQVPALIPDPILLVDAFKDIVWANEAANRLFGEKAIQGRSLYAFLRDPALIKALEDQAGIWTELATPVAERWIVWARAMDRFTLLCLRDVTEIRQTDRMRRDFVANASHELKTPLSSLSGFIETLSGEAGENKETRQRFLEIMRRQTMRMDRLIRDLLSLSRIELTERQAPEGRVYLKQVIQAVIDNLPASSSISFLWSEKIPETLPGDPMEITQVIQNLLDNALRYAKPPYVIEMDLEEYRQEVSAHGSKAGRRMVIIKVKDSGPGIAPKHLPRLTERFYRIDEARSEELGGTGLGLAIVKHILNHHRGSLEIQSQLGKGTVFICYLPMD